MSRSASAPRSRRRCSSSAIDGATMKMRTASRYRWRSCAAPRLLKILYLLADLLQHALGRQRGLAHLEIVGLRGHRVDLPVQLLDQEIERTPHRSVLAEHQRELREVRT